MKINKEFIEKIFNHKIKIKKKIDKIKLSKYDELIPMYDIYSKQIYPITSLNIYYRLKNCHYRFINIEVKNWFINQLKKLDKKSKLYKKIESNIKIINNYDLDTLEKTSYQTLYKFGPTLGLSISICKRNSFNPLSLHLEPYYTKLELIKLGQNMNLIQEIKQEKLIDKILHYKICKKISKNDISNDEIILHNKHIIKSQNIAWISFYSLIGSYLFNKYLRNSLKVKLSSFISNGIIQILSIIKKSPPLNKNYQLYRFIWDDKFLQHLRIGESYIEKGFLSTTRDPFYNPGIKQKFGLILIKINIPKNIKGLGLFIENFSIFPKEEEFLIPPNCKLKLKSKNNDFKYYHTNEIFEKYITKKYEFDLESIDYSLIKNLKPLNISIPLVNLLNIELFGKDRIQLIKNFINKYTNELGEFKIKNKNKEYIFYYNWFDSTDSYSNIYYNNMKDGFIFIYYENGYPIISIECGKEMIVNYIKKYYYSNDLINNSIDEYMEIYSKFAKLFKYKQVKIFLDYKNFGIFSNNYTDDNYKKYLYSYVFCYPLYNYIKNKIKFSESIFVNFPFEYWKLDNFLLLKVPENINRKLNNELQNMTWKNLIITIIEKYFYLYPKLKKWVGNNLFDNCYIILNTISFLQNIGVKVLTLPDLSYSKESIKDDNFELIFRQSFKRTI